jgi:hypothetical protein
LFGIGLAMAVLMDATVIRATLVPAFMRLAGEFNWWAPPFLRRVYERYGIHEAESADSIDLLTPPEPEPEPEVIIDVREPAAKRASARKVPAKKKTAAKKTTAKKTPARKKAAARKKPAAKKTTKRTVAKR